jgi:D-arabinose 1-dehydrogenase-like Zn-dependent alcohol dehydrogenase
VSISALQFAQAAGARVIMTTRSPDHETRLRQLGADDVVIDGHGDIASAIVERTRGLGAETVVNIAAGKTLASSIRSTRVGGRIHLIGYVADTSGTIDIFEAIRHAVTINIGSAGSRSSFEKLVRAMEHQKIRPAVGQVYPVSRLHDAFDQLGRGGVVGKTVIEV